MKRKRLRQALAVALILLGLYLAVFGDGWAAIAFAILGDSAIGMWVELVVPLLPMLVIGLGAALLVYRPKTSE